MVKAKWPFGNASSGGGNGWDRGQIFMQIGSGGGLEGVSGGQIAVSAPGYALERRGTPWSPGLRCNFQVEDTRTVLASSGGGFYCSAWTETCCWSQGVCERKETGGARLFCWPLARFKCGPPGGDDQKRTLYNRLDGVLPTLPGRALGPEYHTENCISLLPPRPQYPTSKLICRNAQSTQL